jgi:histidine triad (HIT) family protein
MKCAFCDIIRGERPARIFYEDEATIAFADINPKAPVHLLICPKEHHERIYKLPDELVLRLTKTIGIIAEKLKLEDNFRLQLNNGAGAGQIIDHLHFHFISHGSDKYLRYRTEV